MGSWWSAPVSEPSPELLPIAKHVQGRVKWLRWNLTSGLRFDLPKKYYHYQITIVLNPPDRATYLRLHGQLAGQRVEFVGTHYIPTTQTYQGTLLVRDEILPGAWTMRLYDFEE